MTLNSKKIKSLFILFVLLFLLPFPCFAQFNDEYLSLKIFEALSHESLMLFPILIFAGLLMNLTPCIYPMIPITINVIYQFHNNSLKTKKVLPLFYCLGIILTYSSLGLFAGLSGHLFGSQLNHPLFLFFISLLLFLLGLTMLGKINLSALQQLAHAIPLTKRFPLFATFTMGVFSALVAAPCVGPVLSTILLLISQSQEPLFGFMLMFFFSLGFSLPYVFLNFIGQKIPRFPKLPRVVNAIKIIFATLMFALSLFYLKRFLLDIPGLNSIYVLPHEKAVLITLLFFFCSLLFFSQNRRFKNFFHLCTLGTGTLLALWATLFFTASFANLEHHKTLFSPVKEEIAWFTDYNSARKAAYEQKKPILFDVWASWCSACLALEKDLWQDKEVREIIQKNFIPLKIDFSNMDKDSSYMVHEKWQIQGLPAVGFLPSPYFVRDSPPLHLSQGKVTKQKLLLSIEQLRKEGLYGHGQNDI